MYLQCQVDVPGQPQPIYAYVPLNIRGGKSSEEEQNTLVDYSYDS
jgi:hypothetical protein